MSLLAAASDGAMGYWPAPEDVVTSDARTIDGSKLASPPTGWPDCFKENKRLKHFLGKKTLGGKRCRLTGAPSAEEAAAYAGVTLYAEDAFGNALAVQKATGWQVVKGFAIFELGDSDGTIFAAHKRWWNEQEEGVWVDPTPRPKGVADMVLLESALSTKEQTKMSRSARAAARERLALGGFPVATDVAGGFAVAPKAMSEVAAPDISDVRAADISATEPAPYKAQSVAPSPRAAPAEDKPRKKSKNSPTEPPPVFEKRMNYGECVMDVPKLFDKSQLGVYGYSQFTAEVKTPTQGNRFATIEAQEKGGIKIYYAPTEPGRHFLELKHSGFAITNMQPFNVEKGEPVTAKWRQLSEEEKLTFMQWVARRLDADGFDCVMIVDSSASKTLVKSTVEEESELKLSLQQSQGQSWGSMGGRADAAGSDRQDPRAKQGDDATESRLALIGTINEGDQQKWLPLQDAIIETVFDPAIYVVPVLREEDSYENLDGKATRERLQRNYTRSYDRNSHKQAGFTLDGRPRTTATLPMRESLADAAADIRSEVLARMRTLKLGGKKDAKLHLELAAFSERWMHASSQKRPQLVAGVQLEGFAPSGFKEATQAGVEQTTAVSQGEIYMDGILYYNTSAQGELHMRRRKEAEVDEPPVKQIWREQMVAIQYTITRAQQVAWLAAAEAFCKACVPRGLSGLLAADNGAPDVKAEHRSRRHDWQQGKVRLSERPAIEFYPHFLSEWEVDHFLRLGLYHAKPTLDDDAAADSAPTGAIVQLSKDVSEADLIVKVVEERIASATGVPAHEGESPLMMRHAMPASAGGSSLPVVDSLHIDTNNEKPFRCATVLMYLNDVPEGQGGETRFPLADLPDGSPLIEAGRQAIEVGLTAITDIPEMPPHIKMLLEASQEDDLCKVKVRPTRGSAITFWTMNEDDGMIDHLTWHAGSRVLEGGGGKWIMQKFKEVPVGHPAYEKVADMIYERPPDDE